MSNGSKMGLWLPAARKARAKPKKNAKSLGRFGPGVFELTAKSPSKLYRQVVLPKRNAWVRVQTKTGVPALVVKLDRRDVSLQSPTKSFVSPGGAPGALLRAGTHKLTARYEKAGQEYWLVSDKWIKAVAAGRQTSEPPKTRQPTAPETKPAEDKGPRSGPIEQALVAQLAKHAPYTYTTTNARYPSTLGLPLKLAPPHQNNCCTFVEALLVEGFRNGGKTVNWTMDRHAQSMINTPDLYGPVTAWVDLGLATVKDEKQVPEPWTLVQGWVSASAVKGGHTFLILDVHGDKVLTLESNNYYNLDGPGFRTVGPLQNFVDQHPGSRWWQRPGVPTWTELRQRYKDMKVAKLHVGDIGWIASGPEEGVESPDSFYGELIVPYAWARGSDVFHDLTCQAVRGIPDDALEVGDPPADMVLHDCVPAKLD